MPDWLQSLLTALALPQFGLSTVFLVSVLSATLLPLGSEWVVIGLVKLDNNLFWPTVLVATVGNTLGGGISWWMGYGAERAYEAVAHRKPMDLKALRWLQQMGPRACFFAFLPGVGDPLCAVAGWLKLPFGPCMAYSLVGKFLRYVGMTAALLWLFPGELTLGG
jgi:membrane protein YqaA with SNARE-associated domain